MKTYVISALSLLTIVGKSQTLSETIVKTGNENFETAASGYRALIAKEPTKGDNYFYYGENFFKREDIDSANVFYSKGVEVNATNPLNYVGLGKVLLSKNKVDDARAQFYKASTLGAGKNAEVLRRTAEAWLVTDNKNPDEAINLLNAAIKLEPKNPENYILLGDAQLEKNPTDGSAPIKSYKMATTLNPKSVKGILREGKLYQRGRNYQLALEKYKEALTIDPNFAPAYREIAEVYSLYSQPAKAIENWKKYLELNNSDFARYRYMSALFSNKQYSDAVKEYENLKNSNYSSLYLERLAGYSYEEMGDKLDKDAYKKGLNAINRFFEMTKNSDFKYLGNDYKYKSIYMFRLGMDSLASLELEKANALEPASGAEIYGKIAKLNLEKKDNEKAVKYYEKKRAGDYKNLNITECYDLGNAYYFMASNKRKMVLGIKDSLTKKKKPADTPEMKAKEQEYMSLYNNADTAFKKVTQLKADYVMGYIWRGRVNSITDPNVEKDSTKTYYEKALSYIKPEEKTGAFKKYVIEANEYLGYYYVTKKDKTNADAAFNLIKELDPNNEKQKSYFAPPKPTVAPKPAPKK